MLETGKFKALWAQAQAVEGAILVVGINLGLQSCGVLAAWRLPNMSTVTSACHEYCAEWLCFPGDWGVGG